MKINNNIIKNNRSYLLFGLFAVCLFAQLDAMKRSRPGGTEETARKRQRIEDELIAKELARKVRELKQDEFFVYEEGTADGVVIPRAVLNLSKTLKNLLEDVGEGMVAIPLLGTPSNVIQDCFGILLQASTQPGGAKKAIENVKLFSLEHLIAVMNFSIYLEIPEFVHKNLSLVVNQKISAMDFQGIEDNDALLTMLNPDVAKEIVSSFVSPCIQVLSREQMNKQKNILLEKGDVSAVAFSQNGKRIVSGLYGNQNNLILWDIKDDGSITQQMLAGHPGDVTAVAFSQNGKNIISGSVGDQNNLILWTINDDNTISGKSLLGHPTDVTSVAFNSDSKTIVSGCMGRENNLILWHITADNNLMDTKLLGDREGVVFVAFSGDGSRMIACCNGKENNLILWYPDAQGVLVQQSLKGHPNNVVMAALSADGNRLVSCCASDVANLIFWNVSNPNADNIGMELTGHTGNVSSVAFSADGKIIVSSSMSNQNNLIVWNVLENGMIKSKSLFGHPLPVGLVNLSRDGKKIVSSCLGKHNTLILWDMSNSSNITANPLPGHEGVIDALAFSPDSTRFVAGSRGKQLNLVLWNLLTDTETRVLKQLNNCTFLQALLVYKIFKAFSKAAMTLQPDSIELKVFMTLPADIQIMMRLFGLVKLA